MSIEKNQPHTIYRPPLESGTVHILSTDTVIAHEDIVQHFLNHIEKTQPQICPPLIYIDDPQTEDTALKNIPSPRRDLLSQLSRQVAAILEREQE